MIKDRKLPTPPPRGMIEIDDAWHPRRYGLLVQRELTCIYGHRIQVGARPFEIAIPCDHLESRNSQGSTRCAAGLYIFTTRPRLVWAMDLTGPESDTINQYSMDVEEIVRHFGVGFPVDMKISRL